MNVLTPFEIGYIMGIAVGEGNFGSGSGSPFFNVTMTAPDLVTLQYLQERIGGKIYGPYQYIAQHTPHHMLRVYGASLAAFSLLCLEYLPESHKRSQFLAWYAYYKPRLDRGRFGPGWSKGLKKGIDF